MYACRFDGVLSIAKQRHRASLRLSAYYFDPGLAAESGVNIKGAGHAEVAIPFVFLGPQPLGNQDMGGSYGQMWTHGVSPMDLGWFGCTPCSDRPNLTEEIHSELVWWLRTYTFRHTLHALQKSMKFVASLCLQTVSGQLWWITLFKFGCDIYIYIYIIIPFWILLEVFPLMRFNDQTASQRIQ